MILAVEAGAAGPIAGWSPNWEVLVPGFAFAIVFALGAARFWRAGRTRRIAQALALTGAAIAVLTIFFGFQEWAA